MELTIFDTAAFDSIFGARTQCVRGVWYDFMQPNLSVISVRNKPEHDERRRLWSPAFSAEALSQYERRVVLSLAKFEKHLEQAAQTQSPLDFNSLCYWFSWDIMGDFAFGESFGMLDGEGSRHWPIKFRRALKVLGILSPVCWLAQIGFSLFPRFWVIGDWNDMMDCCFDKIKTRVEKKFDKTDVSSFLVMDAEKGNLTGEEMRWLKGDAVTMIVAGSDSTAPALMVIIYFLLKFPEHAEKIYDEVAELDIYDAAALRNLDHLNGTINEAMRLFPVIPTGVTRETPPEGVTIGERFIPGNVNIVMPRYVIGRREEYFEAAESFIPERWYSKTDMVKNEKAHVPFNIGKQTCLGKNLALMDIRFVVSSIVKKYTLQCDPTLDLERVVIDMKDEFTACPGSLRIIFHPRA